MNELEEARRELQPLANEVAKLCAKERAAEAEAEQEDRKPAPCALSLICRFFKR